MKRLTLSLFGFALLMAALVAPESMAGQRRRVVVDRLDLAARGSSPARRPHEAGCSQGTSDTASIAVDSCGASGAESCHIECAGRVSAHSHLERVSCIAAVE